MARSGLPEPVIFDFLAHKIDKTMNMPGGPRDEDEVRNPGPPGSSSHSHSDLRPDRRQPGTNP